MNADQALSAFHSEGFAEVELPTDTATRLLRLAERFYAKPLSERLAIAAFRTRGILGYYPSEMEAIKIHKQYGHVVPVFEGPRARGYCSYDYIANEHILAASELFGTNLWPVDEGFRIEACILYRMVSQFVKDLSRSILSYLEEVEKFSTLPRNFLDQECCSIMRLLKYARCQGERRSKSHTDYEFISLTTSDAQGLEVQSPTGLWNIAPCSAGKAVILPGDMLQVATDGWVQSALHRVRFGVEDRLSVIFFQGLGLGQEIVYSVDGERVVSTFEKHLCGMLVKGAAHLQHELQSWEQKLGVTIPEKNPFRRTKEISQDR